ncbi:MAG: hypothetical protein HKN85_00455 [Gammaproteobacteria bacterium]|nr:hypothetical protein [Gammaproteobacteria bacterium]
MSHYEINLQPDKLLQAVLENLNQQFFADSRAQSKLLYKSIADGRQMPFMQIAVDDSGEVICELALDHSQFSGSLNFGKFRKCLAMMLKGLSIKLEKHAQNGEGFNMMNSDQGQLLFNIPGVVMSEDGVNVLVFGLSQAGPGLATIRLMFLDPAQYPILNQPVNHTAEQLDNRENNE